MTPNKPQNKTFFYTVTFFRGLIAQGLEHVVISPGSRSTPLTLSATTFSSIRKHVVLDERSAGFTALGIGKSTNKPAALVCTSGTAVANYFPAVIEARKSGVPMLLLTADRPRRLHGTGANQTINQQHIFGDYPVLFKNMDELSAAEDPAKLKNRASEAWRRSVAEQGPVHLNFPFEKPLEPDQDFLQSISNENKNMPLTNAETPPGRTEPQALDKPVLQAVQNSRRPLIIIGQLTPSADINAIFQLADNFNIPVLSEQGGMNSGFALRGFDGFLRRKENQKQLEPDLILRFGRQPASKSVLLAIKAWEPENHFHFTDDGHKSDINQSVTNFINWNGHIIEAAGNNKGNDDWIHQWEEAEARFRTEKKAALNNAASLTDGHIYHHLTPAIPDDWFVFVGNSFSARDQSLFGRWKTQPRFTNRGASGIDGITSTAMGVNIGQNKPGVLFTGDLSFLHDTNALLNKDKLKQPLVIVVINNRGGSLFRMLPIAEYRQPFTPYFETPQQVDNASLAGSYGINIHTIKNTDELKNTDLRQLVNSSDTNLQVIECQTDPDASMELRKQLWNFKLWSTVR